MILASIDPIHFSFFWNLGTNRWLGNRSNTTGVTQVNILKSPDKFIWGYRFDSIGWIYGMLEWTIRNYGPNTPPIVIQILILLKLICFTIWSFESNPMNGARISQFIIGLSDSIGISRSTILLLMEMMKEQLNIVRYDWAINRYMMPKYGKGKKKDKK